MNKSALLILAAVTAALLFIYFNAQSSSDPSAAYWSGTDGSNAVLNYESQRWSNNKLRPNF